MVKWTIITYITIGLILSEGLIYKGKKSRTKVSVREYLIALLLGPIAVIPTLIIMTFGKLK